MQDRRNGPGDRLLESGERESRAQVAERFLSVRRDLGLSQLAFATALGISLRAEQNYERGARRVPSELLLAVARNFHINPLWLLDGPPAIKRLGQVVESRIDTQTLQRALAMVAGSELPGCETISDDAFAKRVAAIYYFLRENENSPSAENLVRSLLGDGVA